MFVSLRIYLKFLTALFVLAGCCVCSLPAQVIEKTSGEVEVPRLQGMGWRGFGCYLKNEVLDKENFEKLKTDPRNKDCLLPQSPSKIDFESQSLITFRTGGDCFVRAAAKVFRSDEAKKYTVRIKNIWGGCRAGGSFQGWMTVDKIPSDYKVDFAETRVDRYDAKIADDELFFSPSINKEKSNIETLETRRIDLKGCIQTYFQTQFVIRDQETFLKEVRHDASRERCLKEVEEIDFTKYSLLGKEINSGYCGIPRGLKTQATKDIEKKQYLINISYLAPNGTCRALSQYDVWMLVPKIPDGYEALFNVKAEF